MIPALIGLGLGAASFGFGMMQQKKAKKQQAAAYAQQQAGYQMMEHGANIQAQGALQQRMVDRERAKYSVDMAERERNLNLEAFGYELQAADRSLEISRNTVQLEQDIQKQRGQAMELDARRKSLEVVRNQQRARALALTTATAQGAQGGSGLQGGYGQATGQAGTNLMGIQQNLQIGRNIQAFNQGISNNRIDAMELENAYAHQRAGVNSIKAELLYANAVTNANFQGKMIDAADVVAQGQGIINKGQGLVGMSQGMLGAAQSQASFGQSFMNAGLSFANIGLNAGGMLKGFGGSSQLWDPNNSFLQGQPDNI